MIPNVFQRKEIPQFKPEDVWTGDHKDYTQTTKTQVRFLYQLKHMMLSCTMDVKEKSII